MNKTLELIKDSFKKTDLYYQIVDDPNIMMVYVGGSRCIGVTDDHSDYDIVVWCKRSPKNSLIHQFNDTLCSIHPMAHCCNVTAIVDIPCTITWGMCVQLVQFTYLTEEHIIWQNPRCDRLLSLIKSFSQSLRRIGAAKLIKMFRTRICSMIELGNIPSHDYDKILYHFYYCCQIILDEAWDASLASRLKRCEYTPLTDDDINTLLCVMKRCMSIMDTSTTDYLLEWELFLNSFLSLESSID